jgi:uncharacterized protein YkwD
MNLKIFGLLTIFIFINFSCSSDSLEDKPVELYNFSYNNSELDMIYRINYYRESLGLESLDTISHISFKAEEHNDYMISNSVIGHYNFESRSNNIKKVLGATSVSENLAYNYNTNNAALNAWVNSTKHRENIEGNYTHFGISIKINPENGRKYYTNIFIKK